MGPFCTFLEFVNLWLYYLYVIGDYCEVVYIGNSGACG